MSNQTTSKSKPKSKSKSKKIGRFTVTVVEEPPEVIAKFRRGLMSPKKPPQYIKDYWWRSRKRPRRRRFPSKTYRRSKFGITK